MKPSEIKKKVLNACINTLHNYITNTHSTPLCELCNLARQLRENPVHDICEYCINGYFYSCYRRKIRPLPSSILPKARKIALINYWRKAIKKIEKIQPDHFKNKFGIAKNPNFRFLGEIDKQVYNKYLF